MRALFTITAHKSSAKTARSSSCCGWQITSKLKPTAFLEHFVLSNETKAKSLAFRKNLLKLKAKKRKVTCLLRARCCFKPSKTKLFSCGVLVTNKQTNTVRFFVAQRYYRCTSRELKRFQSITLSPLYVHFHETILGLPTIQAFRYSETFRWAEFSKRALLRAFKMFRLLNVGRIFPGWSVLMILFVEL